MNWGRPFKEAAALLLLALGCAAISNALAGPERHLPWVGKYESTASKAPPPAAAAAAAPAPAAASGNPFAPHPDKPWVEISPSEVDELVSRGSTVFDARRSSDYRAGHIAGARSIPIWEDGVDDKVKAFFNEGPDSSAPIVVYCSGGACEDSHMLSQKLYLAGFDDVFVYKDGFPDWQKRGKPIHTGSQP